MANKAYPSSLAPLPYNNPFFITGFVGARPSSHSPRGGCLS
jgi:hypothetical protein